MAITAKEIARRGTLVKVFFNAGGNSQERYVAAVDWDTDPVAVIARFSESLPPKGQPVDVPTIGASVVAPSDKQITEKLTALASINK